MSIIQLKIIELYRKLSTIYIKNSPFLIKFDNFRSNLTIFDINLNLKLNLDMDFEQKLSRRQIGLLESNCKSRFKADSNTIQIEFLANLDLIALAYLFVSLGDQASCIKFRHHPTNHFIGTLTCHPFPPQNKFFNFAKNM